MAELAKFKVHFKIIGEAYIEVTAITEEAAVDEARYIWEQGAYSDICVPKEKMEVLLKEIIPMGEALN